MQPEFRSSVNDLVPSVRTPATSICQHVHQSPKPHQETFLYKPNKRHGQFKCDVMNGEEQHGSSVVSVANTEMLIEPDQADLHCEMERNAKNTHHGNSNSNRLLSANGFKSIHSGHCVKRDKDTNVLMHLNHAINSNIISGKQHDTDPNKGTKNINKSFPLSSDADCDNEKLCQLSIEKQHHTVRKNRQNLKRARHHSGEVVRKRLTSASSENLMHTNRRFVSNTENNSDGSDSLSSNMRNNFLPNSAVNNKITNLKHYVPTEAMNTKCETPFERETVKDIDTQNDKPIQSLKLSYKLSMAIPENSDPLKDLANDIIHQNPKSVEVTPNSEKIPTITSRDIPRHQDTKSFRNDLTISERRIKTRPEDVKTCVEQTKVGKRKSVCSGQDISENRIKDGRKSAKIVTEKQKCRETSDVDVDNTLKCSTHLQQSKMGLKRITHNQNNSRTKKGSSSGFYSINVPSKSFIQGGSDPVKFSEKTVRSEHINSDKIDLNTLEEIISEQTLYSVEISGIVRQARQSVERERGALYRRICNNGIWDTVKSKFK